MGATQPIQVDCSVKWFGIPGDYLDAASNFALPIIDCLHSPLHRVLTSRSIVTDTVGKVDAHAKDRSIRLLARQTLSIALGAALTAGYILQYEATVLVSAFYDVVIGAYKLAQAVLRDHDLKGCSHLIDVTVGLLNVVALAIDSPLFEVITLAATILQDAWKVNKSIDKGVWTRATAHAVLPILRVAHNIDILRLVLGPG